MIRVLFKLLSVVLVLSIISLIFMTVLSDEGVQFRTAEVFNDTAICI